MPGVAFGELAACLAYREALLPLNGAGCIVLGSCRADVLLWHCQLDKEVFPSTQQDAMHYPEVQESLMLTALRLQLTDNAC